MGSIVEKNCLNCDYCFKQFFKKPSKIAKTNNFCSKNCKNSFKEKYHWKSQIRVCVECNINFFPIYKIQIYCSRRCFSIVRGREKTKNNTFETNCDWCNVEIRKRISQKTIKNFCSQECSQKYKRGNDNKFITKLCEYCDTPFETLYRRQAKYCNKKCATIFKSGTENYMYGKVNGMSGRIAWNRGLTKNTDERLFNLGQKIKILWQTNEKWKQRDMSGHNNPNYGKTTKDRTSQQLLNYSIGTWKRFNASSKSGFGFLKGFYFSSKMNKKFRYRSSFELKLMEVFDADPNVILFEYEPFGIPYNNIKHYYPDFLIVFKNNIKKLIEVKGWVENEKIFQEKCNAAIKYCKENNFNAYEVWKKDKIFSYINEIKGKNK